MVAQPTVWPADCAGTLGQSASGTGSPGYSNQEIFSQNAANLIPQPVPIQDGREMQKAQNGIGVGDQGDPAYTLDTTGAQAVGQPVPFTKSKRAQSVTDDETWVDGQVNPTLSLFDQGDTRATTIAVGFNWQNGGGYGNANDGLGITVEGTGPLQRCNTPAVAQAMTVRRLTPRECERLQGFPDDYTLIPWRKKPASECPDGPRYKALGNSMATNVVTWIGERIQAYETETKVRAAQTMDSRGNPSA